MPTPYTIDYLFEGKAHVYLPDAIGQLLDGSLLIAEAGLERDKRRERNRAKAEAARQVAEQQAGVYWIATETTLSRTRHANLVFLHARRQAFPTWPQLEEAGPRHLALGGSRLCAGTGRTSRRTLAAGGAGSSRLEAMRRERGPWSSAGRSRLRFSHPADTSDLSFPRRSPHSRLFPFPKT